MKKQFQIYGLLTVLALSSWLLSDWMSPKPDAAEVSKGNNPDSYSRQFTKTVMSKDGNPDNKLSAESMTHFKKAGITKIEKLVFVFFNGDQPPWIVRSDTGTILSHGKEIHLRGSVVISRAGSADVRQVDITTESLNVHPRKNYAESSEFVQLISKGSQISGTGLKVHFGELKTVQLLSKVRGKYESL